MSILVTGGAGYIGSHMVLELLDRGEDIVIIDDLSTGIRQSVPDSLKLFVGDIGDLDFTYNVLRSYAVETIFHFAGSVIVPESVSNPLKYYQNNTANSRNLLASATRAGVRFFVFSSTAAVYGSISDQPVREESPLRPDSPYGRSKLMTEMMLQDVSEAHELRYAILRYFNVAGADPGLRTGQSTPNATHLIKVAAEAAVGKRKTIEIFGGDYPTPDGTCIRDFIHVADLVAAHAAALRHLRNGGENVTLNCGYGRGYSVLDVVKATKRLSGADFPTPIVNRRPGDISTVIANSELLRSKLGWKPNYDDLDLIVDHAIRWERHVQKLAR
jgi:UDP-glucose 4-epimerase